MKEEKDYIGDIAAIRSMMERTSKFLSLSGWAGIMAGIYALIGAWAASTFLSFNPREIFHAEDIDLRLIGLALGVLVLTLATAILLSSKKASKRNERVWNATAKQMIVSMSIPLVAGGLLVIVMIIHGLIGLIAPLTLIFYGLSMYNASKFTYTEMKLLGISEIALGLFSSYFVEYGLLCWGLGFGILHIITGIYLHYKYEK